MKSIIIITSYENEREKAKQFADLMLNKLKDLKEIFLVPETE